MSKGNASIAEMMWMITLTIVSIYHAVLQDIPFNKDKRKWENLQSSGEESHKIINCQSFWLWLSVHPFQRRDWECTQKYESPLSSLIPYVGILPSTCFSITLPLPIPRYWLHKSEERSGTLHRFPALQIVLLPPEMGKIQWMKWLGEWHFQIGFTETPFWLLFKERISSSQLQNIHNDSETLTDKEVRMDKRQKMYAT